MTDAEWLKQIEDDPGDVVTKLAYADWLRDRGEDARAAAWAWMARRGMFPVMLAWYNAAAYGDSDPNSLPEGVFQALPGDLGFCRVEGHWVYFRTLADAVDALAAALAKLSTPGSAGAGPASRPGRTATTAPPGGAPAGG